MRMLFADTLPRHHLDRLTDAGHVCVVEEGLTADSLPDRIAGFDALVVRSTRVTAATLDRADELGLIVRAGAGTDTIDIQGAADRGIYVCNVPGTNAVAVAELAMGLLLAVDRHIADGTADLRQGVWNKSRYQQARGLYGRTVAIIGLGEIGLAFAARARAFGLEPTA
ncbi:MAG: NAD(P)-dependent oxidoreductase, partial [Actinomycetota bacterium]